jgi:hypothetical protein
MKAVDTNGDGMIQYEGWFAYLLSDDSLAAFLG